MLSVVLNVASSTVIWQQKRSLEDTPSRGWIGPNNIIGWIRENRREPVLSLLHTASDARPVVASASAQHHVRHWIEPARSSRGSGSEQAANKVRSIDPLPSSLISMAPPHQTESCSGSSAPATVTTVDVTAARDLIAAGGGHRYLDVRTEEELSKLGHLVEVNRCINVPYMFITSQGKQQSSYYYFLSTTPSARSIVCIIL
jgi:hypothetical protein